MVRFFSLFAVGLLFFAGPVRAQDDEEIRIRIAVAVKMAELSKPVVKDDKPPVKEERKAGPNLSYSYVAKLAERDGKMVAVFVGGIKSRPIPGVYVAEEMDFVGWKEKGIAIGFPDGECRTFPANASDDEILGKAVRRNSPELFTDPLQPFKERSLIADDSGSASGRWPEWLGIPDGMQRYGKARRTQSISVSNGRDSIISVPIQNLPDARWHQPGGLAGVRGWKSELYKSIPGGAPRTWVGDIEVENSIFNPYYGRSDRQMNRGWKRSYPNGSTFMEVMTNEDGDVFEHRQSEKIDGKWVFRVLYSDKAARPAGYVGVKNSECITCHSEAGTGGYNAGLVPGGDFVLSDPFSALER